MLHSSIMLLVQLYTSVRAPNKRLVLLQYSRLQVKVGRRSEAPDHFTLKQHKHLHTLRLPELRVI